MHTNKVSRNLSPYTVIADGRFVDRARTISELFHVLRNLSQSLRDQGRSIAFTNDYLDMGIPDQTHVKVFDARGSERPELADYRAIHRRFNVSPGKLHRVVDHGWDAEHRPRGFPIPGTGRSSGYGFLRRPSTQSERRQAFLCSEEGEPVPSIRPRRRAHLIPNAWDDDLRSDYGHRNWKRHRKTQWKPKHIKRTEG